MQQAWAMHRLAVIIITLKTRIRSSSFQDFAFFWVFWLLLNFKVSEDFFLDFKDSWACDCCVICPIIKNIDKKTKETVGIKVNSLTFYFIFILSCFYFVFPSFLLFFPIVNLLTSNSPIVFIIV